MNKSGYSPAEFLCQSIETVKQGNHVVIGISGLKYHLTTTLDRQLWDFRSYKSGKSSGFNYGSMKDCLIAIEAVESKLSKPAMNPVIDLGLSFKTSKPHPKPTTDLKHRMGQIANLERACERHRATIVLRDAKIASLEHALAIIHLTSKPKDPQ